MPEYRISKRAREKLVEIYAYTELQFGGLQADAYNVGFEKLFELIASFPGVGRSADELKPGYRRYRHQAHYIFYTIGDGHVLIETILHTAEDLRPDLFD
jgi:toxin ParE1/3/4